MITQIGIIMATIFSPWRIVLGICVTLVSVTLLLLFGWKPLVIFSGLSIITIVVVSMGFLVWLIIFVFRKVFGLGY